MAKRTQRVAPNNVAICCVGLRSFGLKNGYIIVRLVSPITNSVILERLKVAMGAKSKKEQVEFSVGRLSTALVEDNPRP